MPARHIVYGEASRSDDDAVGSAGGSGLASTRIVARRFHAVE